MIEGKTEFARAWNFGPNAEDNRRVIDILDALKLHWPEINYRVTAEPQPHEANLLYLDNSLAKSQLHWQPVWTLQETLKQTAHWYQAQAATGSVSSQQQLNQFVQHAREALLEWVS